MKHLKDIFPKASQSFIKANPELSEPLHGTLVVPEGKGPWPVIQSVDKVIRGKMNKTEAEFALRLEAMKRAGEILRYEFQGITLRWFDMRYTPDFVVFLGLPHNRPREIKMIEVKGPHIHYRQQALARFKGARGFWPEFTFELWQRQKGGIWKQVI